MIDDEHIAAHRARGLSPDHPGDPRHRPQPRHLLPGPRGLQPLLRRRAPASWRGSSTVRGADRAPLQAVRLLRGPDAERVVVLMGSGVGDRGEAVERSSPTARRSASSPCASTAPSRSSTSLAALPETVKSIAVLDRTKEPGAPGEPLFQDVVSALGDEARRRDAPDDARCRGHRRAVRALEQGVHAGDGQGGVRRAAAPDPRRRFTVGITDDVTHLSLDWDRELPSSPTTCSARCSSASAPTAPSGRTRTRSRSSASTPTGTPGLLRLRLEEVGVVDGLAPPLRAEADPLDVPDRRGPVRRVPPVQLPGEARRARRREGATVLLNSPVRAGRVWDELPGRGAEHIVEKKLKCS
jgi:pyruvate-ferredoxin/flavodoxin oxidoreductase